MIRVLVIWLLLIQLPGADGPGYPQQTWTEGQILSQVSRPRLYSDQAENAVSGAAVALSYMYRGWWIGRGAGDSVWDISDPTAPKRIWQRDQSGKEHKIAFVMGTDLALGQHVYDLSDPTSPGIVNYQSKVPRRSNSLHEGVQLPLVWHGQAHYGDGFDRVRLLKWDPYTGDREVVKDFDIRPLYGVKESSIITVGNLMVILGPQTCATFDISDYHNPRLLDVNNEGRHKGAYGGGIYGDRIFITGDCYDISDPTDIQYVGEYGGNKGITQFGYHQTFQHGFLHLPGSPDYMKINVETLESELTVPINTARTFCLPVGNIAVCTGKDMTILAHSADPDRQGPSVTKVSPAPNAVNQHPLSRIGLVMDEWPDPQSIEPGDLIVRKVGGGQVQGMVSVCWNILNFVPDEVLDANATYEVVLKKDGISDIVGNTTGSTFMSRFSTGASIVGGDLAVTPRQPGASEVASEVIFDADVVESTGGVEFRWDFGDGDVSPWSSSSSAVHTYRNPGHYTVILRARDEQKRINVPFRQIIHRKLAAVSPSQAATIAYDQVTGRIWNVNPDNDTVTCIDATSLEKLFEVSVGRNPRSLAVSSAGEIAVACAGNDKIDVLAATDGRRIKRIHLPHGDQPSGVAWSPDGVFLYASLSGAGAVFKISRADDTRQRSAARYPTIRGICVSGDGEQVLAARFISSSAQGEVYVLRGTNLNHVTTIPLALDDTEDTEGTGRGLLNYCHHLAINPDGTEATLPAKKDNILRGEVRDGLGLNVENAVRTVLSRIKLGENTEDPNDRTDFNDSDSATAVCYSPVGNLIFTALQGNNAIQIVDSYSGEVLGGIEGVGQAPQGVCISDGDQRLFVHGFLSRSVEVYDIADVLAMKSIDATFIKSVSVVEREALTPEALRGKQLFYHAGDPRMTSHGYISCASCHIDGGHDGQTWDFTDRGEGLRNTISLHGRRGIGHGPVHWSGNFDEIHDFEHDMRQHFGGIGFMTDDNFTNGTTDSPLGDPKAGLSDDLDDLAAYVTSLADTPRSPYRNNDGTVTAAADRGRLVFRELNCAACHAGSDFTDSAVGVLHDIGSITLQSGQRLGQELSGIDTPTLLGLWDTAPYLHDGRASNLHEVFADDDLDGPHGIVHTRSQQDHDDLIAYLLQLEAGDRNPGAATMSPSVFRTIRVRVSPDSASDPWISPDAASIGWLGDGGARFDGLSAKEDHILDWASRPMGVASGTSRAP